MKLWQKNTSSLAEVEAFTVGRDREMDSHLARFDVLGSLAHCHMLAEVGLLTQHEWISLKAELQRIYQQFDNGSVSLEEGVEDIHSQVELMLTRTLGDTGKKIHSGRSRNDQVLVDIKLYLRHEIKSLIDEIKPLFDLLLAQSETYALHLMPGYTHLQLAMPSSFGLWFGAYAESLVDDVITLHGAYRVVNKNPLGSAAGYGSSFPLNRSLTTSLLGFDALNYNVVYAQMGRGKTERIVAASLANVAATLSKLSMDACLFLNQNFAFIQFPDELTTGSSIMPHKKNPDVFELVRARCNQLQALPNDIALMTANLPSGYHRDLQLLKETLFPAVHNLKECIKMVRLMLSSISVRENILTEEKYKYLFSVEEVNKKVLAGLPFRDAYKAVAAEIADGTFAPDRQLVHTHAGSIGNLCHSEIKQLMNREIAAFNFEKVDDALKQLLA